MVEPNLPSGPKLMVEPELSSALAHEPELPPRSELMVKPMLLSNPKQAIEPKQALI